MIKNDHGIPFSATATGSTSAAASKTGVASTTIYITDISGSSDKSGALILVKDGSTVIWQDIVGAGNYKMNFITPIKITTGATASVNVDGTSLSNANLSGFVLNNS
jgi:hypothetical protein